MCMKPSQSMFDLAKHKTAEFLDSCRNASKKVKNGVVVGATTVGAVASQAAVVYDDATNKLTGSIDMGPFYSGVGIAFAVIGAVLAVGLAISIVKRGK